MKKNKLNLILPLATTFILMVLLVVYTSRLFYRISVTNIYEVGSDKISGISAELDNYLDTAKSVLWVTADTVDYMIQGGYSNEKILGYITAETENQKSQFDENYTGIYGCIRGEYLDGLGWEPPGGYEPTQRDWYITAKEAGGGLAIVSPYVDAQTGSVVISICKQLADGQNVLSVDLITNHIQDIIGSTDINGKGYGFLLDRNGLVIAHHGADINGTEFCSSSGGAELFGKLTETGNGHFEHEITVFVNELMDQWYTVIVVGNDELFRDVYSQLTINIATNAIVFMLMALFYYIAYRRERKSSLETEALKISEQQKAYEAEILRLEKTAADLRNRAKSQFLAQMSHEIRTPINAVLGMNEMILRETSDSSILGYSENIQTAGRTLLSIINSILDFSKIEDGKMEIIPVQYDTASVVNNLVNSVSERASSKGLRFTVMIDPELPCMLVGDEIRLTQVIMNLLTNAVKYTERGAVVFEMKCGERTDSEITVCVSVKDTGIGIREEDMEKLFESFTRLDETRNRNIEGTGLGMAIVTGLLELMGSKLEVRSVYRKGSVFSFEIKQGIADAKPVGDILGKRSDPPERKPEVQHRFPGARVLVTDDNELNRMVAMNLLKLFGIKPELVSSGGETIEKMQKERYDIVFLDHMMPELDGIETLSILKEQSLIPAGTKMIALTANAVIGARESYLKAGFDDYLTKPIELEALEEKLTLYLKSNEEPAAPADAGEPEIMEFEPVGDSEVMEFEPDADTDGPAAEEMTEEMLGRLENAGFSVRSGLSYCAGDAAFYRSMLTGYAQSADDRIAELRSALADNDTKKYQVVVHALKSASKTVGADDVSELARKLETAAGSGDTGYIEQHSAGLEKLFTDRAAFIKKVLE